MRRGATGAVFVAGLVVLVLVGSAEASAGPVLTAVPVSQGIRDYQAGSDGVNGYSAATIALTTVPGGTTVCTTGTKNIPLTLGSATLVFSATTGGTTCTAGDFSEEFTIAFSATIGTQTNTFAVTTATGGGVPGVNQEAVKLGVIGLPLPFVATVHIYIDYGSSSQPAQGIAILDLSIT